jgi:hypothetical protein
LGVINVLNVIDIANLLDKMQRENKSLKYKINSQQKEIERLKNYIKENVNNNMSAESDNMFNYSSKEIKRLLDTDVIAYDRFNIKLRDIILTIFCDDKCFKEDMQSIVSAEDNEYKKLVMVLLCIVGKTYDAWRVKVTRNKASSIVQKLKENNCECKVCGRHLEAKEVEVHHIIPVECGGGNSRYNLMTLCHKCHNKENKKNKKYKKPRILFENFI